MTCRLAVPLLLELPLPGVSPVSQVEIHPSWEEIVMLGTVLTANWTVAALFLFCTNKTEPFKWLHLTQTGKKKKKSAWFLKSIFVFIRKLIL